MSMVKLDRHTFKSIRQQDFDNILREFSRDPRCVKLYSITDDKELEKFIRIEKGKLVFDYVIFNNISIDIILYDVNFTNCLFYNCNFKTIMEDCNMINSLFKLCTFDKWIVKRGDFKNLDFVACELALDTEDKIIPQKFNDIRFCRCNGGSINVKTTCNNIQFEHSSMFIRSSYNINNTTVERSNICFILGGSLYGNIRFSYSEIELRGLDNNRFYISGEIFVNSSKVSIDTTRMEGIKYDDIMKIKSLNSNIIGTKIGYFLESIDVDIFVNNIIQTGNIGSMHARTYYDAVNDLVRCGEPIFKPLWSGDDCLGGSLEKFIARIDEVYPESSDDPKHKKYREEYMNAINLFKSKKKSYAKKKEEYIKLFKEYKRTKKERI